MNDTVRVLMERDGLTEEQALQRFNEVKYMIYNESGWSCEVVEDILACELGLEMDYIMDFI